MSVYYEGLYGELVPCKVVDRIKSNYYNLTGNHDVVIKLTRSRGCYKAGETLTVPARSVVEKVGKLVRPVVLTC